MTSQPPQQGLTRIDTGYPHPLFPRWFLTPEEVRNVQRRSDHRNHANNGEMAAQSMRTTRDCKKCGMRYPVNIYTGRSTCPNCRTRQGGGAPRMTALTIKRTKGMSE